MNDKKQSIDNSRLSTYETCPQLFDYKYNYELEEESGHAARFSTFMIHKPVQEWWRNKGKFEPNWQHYQALWAPTTEDMIADKVNAYTAQNAQNLFNNYVERNLDLLDDYEFIEAEVYKTRSIGEGKKPWGSKTDIVLGHKESQRKHVVEIKASKYDYILIGMNFNTQVLGELYVNDAKKILIDFFYLAGKKSSYMRFELEPSVDEIKSWLERVAFRCKVLEDSERYGIYPTREASCKRFNKKCKFLPICDLGGPATEAGKRELTKYPTHDSMAYLEVD